LIYKYFEKENRIDNDNLFYQDNRIDIYILFLNV